MLGLSIVNTTPFLLKRLLLSEIEALLNSNILFLSNIILSGLAGLSTKPLPLKVMLRNRRPT